MTTERLVALNVIKRSHLVPGYFPDVTVETSAHLMLSELLRWAHRGRDSGCSVLPCAHWGLALVHSDEVRVDRVATDRRECLIENFVHLLHRRRPIIQRLQNTFG